MILSAYDEFLLKTTDCIDWCDLNNKTIYITGATGLIGSNLVQALLLCTDAHIVVQVRNELKAKKMFGNNVEYIIGELQDKSDYSGDVDYVVHCANPTSSSFFVNNPVETIETAVDGTNNILEFAKNKRSTVVFLSTMEVYGFPRKGHVVKECEGGSFDSLVVRNCYPLSKQVCESLCAAYASEYGVHTRVLRLTQTFGPGVSYNDGRVFAEFARCAIEKRNIILKTAGETERSYLYTIDAVLAILTVLLKGADGEAYTAANESTFCSILDMANLVADIGGVNVLIEKQDISMMGYTGTLHMNLSTEKLKNLGWKAQVGLKEMYKSMIGNMINNLREV